jgi:NAD-dependent SIR2 family protein deacetylase
VVEINLEPTPYSHQLDLALQGKAGEILPQVVEGME